MSADRRLVLWVAILAAAGGVLFLLRGVLFPFVAGMAVAYLLDPLVDKLEARKLSRTLATLVVLGAFLVVAVALLVVIVPVAVAQGAAFAANVPGYVDQLRELFEPLAAQLRAAVSAEDVERLRDAAGTHAIDAAKWLGRVLGGLWSGGLAVLNVLSLVLIMPLVAFYQLHEWDRIVAWVDGLLPRYAADDIRGIARDIDGRLAGFVRGQATVCLVLGTIYAVGLSLIGLDFGLLIGLGAGVISFIPYLGTFVGLAVGLGLALAQFDSWLSIGLVAAVFGVGQVLEGYVLTPRLVGGKVGLHPAWVLFALMAGGALFGFTGVLLALPAAAAIGVVVRYWLDRYRRSPLYTGVAGTGRGPLGEDGE